MEVSIQVVEGVVPLASPALQLLLPTSRARRASVKKKHERRKSKRRDLETPRNQLT
jgi:hypothetical protein